MIEKAFEKIRRKISNITAYGRIHKVSGDKSQVTFLQNETMDRVPMMQHYGFFSSPPKGSTCFAISSGDRDSLTIVGTEHYSKPSLESGEVSLFSKYGSSLLFDQEGNATLEAKKIDIKANQKSLIDVLAKIFQEISIATVDVNGTPKPLINSSKLMILKTELEGFK